MFKVESYITPLLLSYVDKYIKNFKPEDSQVLLYNFIKCLTSYNIYYPGVIMGR